MDSSRHDEAEISSKAESSDESEITSGVIEGDDESVEDPQVTLKT